MKFEITHKYLKKMDRYVFFVCSRMVEEMERVRKLMGIEKFPKKLIENFHGKMGEEVSFYMDDKEICFVGYGKKKDCDISNLFHVFGKLGKKMQDDKKKTWIELVGLKVEDVENEVIGFILGNYEFGKYKTNEENKKKGEGRVYFYLKNRKMDEKVRSAMEMAFEQNEVRSLINEPANILNSQVYVNYIRKHKHANVKMRVLEEKQLKKEGLNLILAVNAGSKNPAKMVILEYCSSAKEKKEKSVCLVGKGVMFDTGGYNLKTGDFADMKEDMAGSAIVFGMMNLIAEMKWKGRYVGILPIVENMVDGRATRPGDVVKSYNGKTVEITDTDAEGRLILADAIAYTENYKPKMILDVATLTGSAAYIFGNKATAIMGYRNGLIHELKEMGEKYHEHMWDLPMWEEYLELTKSQIADYKNLTTTAHAGAIMGGAFLYHFVPKEYKDIQWVHMDIAGVDYLPTDTITRSQGATAESFSTIFHFLQKMQK